MKKKKIEAADARAVTDWSDAGKLCGGPHGHGVDKKMPITGYSYRRRCGGAGAGGE